MRKFSLLVLLVVLFAFNVYAADPKKRHRNTILIMSGQTIVAGGTSTFIIDLKSAMFDPILEGDCSLQFSGVTCAWEVAGSVSPMGGATVNASYRVSLHLPSGTSVPAEGLLTGVSRITARLESVDIVTDLAHDTGDTEYCYGFWPEKCRYLIIDVTAGATPMFTDVYVDVD